jgi:malonyl-CoA decarboxylase
MREVLLSLLDGDEELAAVDSDFAHLLSSWFNRGFLILRHISWSSPADMLEKIIRYEAVHEIKTWNDLRGRLKPSDRRCFGFFHPQMHDEPLIFVEVALTHGIPAEIADLLSEDRPVLAETDADTAVFYSISNTQAGLRGVSFGNFLIKQVVDDLLRELPGLKSFVTLSPVPGFAAWLAKQDTPLSRTLAASDWHSRPKARGDLKPFLEKAAATYLLEAKNENGKPIDPVARFHLNNGASLERINFCGDLSPKGLRQSHGLMVNYLYDPAAIERNHELYANTGEVAASQAVRRLLTHDGQASVVRNIQSRLKRKKVSKVR